MRTRRKTSRGMRIYAVADIHGKASRIETVARNVEALRPDLLVLPGDITGPFFKERALERLGGLGVEVLAVRGNSEWFMADNAFSSHGMTSLHLREVKKGGIMFAGVGGAVPLPFRTRVRFFETRLIDSLWNLIDEDSIFVTHAPPYGARDQVMGKAHAGSRLVREIVDERKPAMVLCGHIHEGAGISHCGETLVVNCSFYRNKAGALIEFGKTSRRHKVEILP